MFEFRFLVQNGAVCHIKIEQPRETQDGFVTDVRFFLSHEFLDLEYKNPF